MSNCGSCGTAVPDGQRYCSRCYGDIDYGRDGYYRQSWEDSVREEYEKEMSEDAFEDKK